MLKHYDVTIQGDRIQWLGEKPKAQSLRAILIIEEEPSPSTHAKRTTPTHLIGKGKTLWGYCQSYRGSRRLGMSKMIILDTHIWFWYINESFEQFPLEWTAQIRQADRVGVSPISCYEMALAHHKGRLELDIPIQQWLLDALTPSGIELLPLTPEITLRAVNLSSVHKDPFDRIIVGTTLEYQAKLASIDSLFPKYPELKDYLMSA